MSSGGQIDSESGGVGRGVLGAIYLACSWTWVIGMFLPVLQVRDYGWPGYVVFLVPNCVGAMSIGFLLKSGWGEGGAGAFLRKHGHAVALFSAVTVLFHLYFLGGIAQEIGQTFVPGVMPGGAWAAVVVIALGNLWIGGMRTGGWWARAVVVLGVSGLAVWLAYWTTGGHAYALPRTHGTKGYTAMALAGPAIVFGFLMCPYLDVSFLRTRAEESARVGRLAFVLSFALFFPALVLFTLAYSEAFNGGAGMNNWFYLHMAVQASFTIGVHLREQRAVWRGTSKWVDETNRRGVVFWQRAVWLAAGPAIVVGAMAWEQGWFRFGYESILSMYGFVLPGYVWSRWVWGRMVGGGGVGAWLASVGVATPGFAYGYLMGEHFWMAMGVAVVVFGPVFAAVWGRRGLAGGG